ncbi:MAG: hypothetical protein LBD75_02895 [Candidatus Peribacteria bacterium]|jgi:type I site-specific restriction-modification system R (restriction) subunit|nr:hypothetical protein [Candidatus Peribacteria bacterium]
MKILTLLQEKHNSKQIKKELQEKKESIINPKAEHTSETDENFQEVIEDAIGNDREKMIDERENAKDDREKIKDDRTTENSSLTLPLQPHQLPSETS